MPKTYQKYQYLLKRKSPKTNDIARFDILNSRIRDFSIFFVMNNISLRYLFQTQAICCSWKMVYNIDFWSLILFIRLCVERRQNVVHFFAFGKWINFKLFRFLMLHIIYLKFSQTCFISMKFKWFYFYLQCSGYRN